MASSNGTLTHTDEIALAIPQDIEAEQAVIGSVLKDNAAIGQVADLSPATFYSPTHRAIWKAMLWLWERGKPIDFHLLGDRLKGDDGEPVVTMLELSEINLQTPSAAHIEHYASLVRNKATLRSYINVLQEITSMAWRSDTLADELALFAEHKLAMARPTDANNDLYTPERWADVFAENLQGQKEGSHMAVQTGFADIDPLTLGLWPGAFYLLMGITGTGKTELAFQVACHVAEHYGPVLYGSLEMGAVELGQRYVRLRGGVDRNNLATGHLDDQEMNNVTDALNAMAAGNLYVWTPDRRATTAELAARASLVQSQAGRVRLIVADYVQRFEDKAGRNSSREEDVANIATNLKWLAREMKCPVLAPVQPNRQYETRQDKRPRLADLRESGRLEQEADVVFGLYREDRIDPEAETHGLAELLLLKNRSGNGKDTGKAVVVWTGNKYANYLTPPQAHSWHGELP
jgi:replicative DNA helicase